MEHNFEIICFDALGQKVNQARHRGQRARACEIADGLLYSEPKTERAKVYLCSVGECPMPMQVLIYETRLPWLGGMA